MKVITVVFDNSVDISAITEGAIVSVNDGTHVVSDGSVLFTGKMADPDPPTIPNHRHEGESKGVVVTGPPITD